MKIRDRNQEKSNWQEKFTKREKEIRSWWPETEDVSLTAMAAAGGGQVAKLRRDLFSDLAQELEGQEREGTTVSKM